MSNSPAISDMDNWIRQLRQMPGLLEEAIPEIQGSISGLLDDSISKSTSPDGKVWARRKDGRRALQGIDKYVSIQRINTEISIKLAAPATYHQEGGKNLPQRQIIPNSSLPDSWRDAIEKALERAYIKRMNK